jgi:iron-sulfur cluster repair protein YtfE (RIC family)
VKFEILKSMREEHEALHTELLRASKEPSAIGAAATELMRLMKPHIEKEERYGMPPLALLARLAKGEVDNDMGKVLELTERLKTELPAMLAEHKFITRALHRLIEAARKGDRVELAELAVRLVHHMRLEEEIIYPASLLVGEVVALKLGLKR